MTRAAIALPRRFRLLPLLHQAHGQQGFLDRALVERVASEAGIPTAEAWEAATSYPDFRFAPTQGTTSRCGGLSCALNGEGQLPGASTVGCQFRCYDAPVEGEDHEPGESVIRKAGPLLSDDSAGFEGLARASELGQAEAIALVDRAGLRGRGGAYFPTARKWQSALAQGRPLALVVNAEEGEPGVFKDRVVLCRRPLRFIEGLAIAREVLQPAVTVIFINGEAKAARAALERAMVSAPTDLTDVEIVAGGGGYVLGEESALLNAIEGRKPVPRVRPPYPVEAGLFGMPTVVNNVETLSNLPLIFGLGDGEYRQLGTAEAPGTKLFSLSGRVARPGLYEAALGTSIQELLDAAGGGPAGRVVAALVGGPSGGFLPAAEFGRRLLPGLMHPTGAVAGSGGSVFVDETSDIRQSVLAMAQFNAEESCGKCTPCREGTPRLADGLARGDDLADLLEVVGTASLCGLGQMAPGPIRSGLAFWPELFR